jgi:hypothetical protein
LSWWLIPSFHGDALAVGDWEDFFALNALENYRGYRRRCVPTVADLRLVVSYAQIAGKDKLRLTASALYLGLTR